MILSQRNLCGQVILGLIFTFLITRVRSHGRLIEPPSRSSMWRYGFDTPHDYNDHETYCGGFSRHWESNDGKCGVCGDAWDEPEPRAHETGGTYGNGVIVRQYPVGSVIPVKIELTVNHMGYFEFRICAMKYSGVEVTEDCLDEHKLKDRYGNTRWYPEPRIGIFENEYKLPDDLDCAQCVFQWRYFAGNNWGDCGNGTSVVGCGLQEEFRACADVTVGDNEARLALKPDIGPRRPFSSPSSSYSTLMFNLIVAGTCLLVISTVLACVFGYYYQAERAKHLLMANRWFLPENPPTATPRTKRQPGPTSHIQL